MNNKNIGIKVKSKKQGFKFYENFLEKIFINTEKEEEILNTCKNSQELNNLIISLGSKENLELLDFKENSIEKEIFENNKRKFLSEAPIPFNKGKIFFFKEEN